MDNGFIEMENIDMTFGVSDKTKSGKASDSKRNKVYVKLCENKIKSLEDQLNRHYKIDIDDEVLSLAKNQLENSSINLDSLEPIVCKFYPSQSFFKSNSRFANKIDLTGELKLNDHSECEYMTQQRSLKRCTSLERNRSYETLKDELDRTLLINTKNKVRNVIFYLKSFSKKLNLISLLYRNHIRI